MSPDKETLAFWLMPSAETKPFFVSLVEELARRLNAPVFEPHVTLQGAEMDGREALALLEKIAANHSPVELQIAGIEFSEKYSKTLYVQFTPVREATAISDAFADGAGSDSGYQFDPHLSLLYKTMAEAEQEELARQITIPFAHVRCDAVKLVSVPRPVEGPEDVHAWSVLAEQPLGGATK